jgi:isocitrate dehydrogenase kinase/phosphatase
VIFRRGPFAELIERQLDMFERDHHFVVEEVAERLTAFEKGDRDEAEELYGDYIDAVETGTEILADIRDAYKQTLEEGIDEEYERAFHRAVAKRLKPFALEIENR